LFLVAHIEIPASPKAQINTEQATGLRLKCDAKSQAIPSYGQARQQRFKNGVINS
jgi:hypothetical protein